MHKTLFRSFTLLLFIALAVLMVTACGRSASETPVSPSNGETASYEMDAESAQTSGETSIHDSTGTGTQEPSLSANQTPPPTEKGEEVSASISEEKTTTTITPTTQKSTTQTSKKSDTTASSTRPATTATTAAPLSPSGYQQEVLRLVNIEREKAGKQPLSADINLTKAAQVRAREIADTFSHSRPDGRDCFTAMKEAGVSYRAAGENIAMGQKTPAQVVEGWMNSDGHRRNILSDSFGRLGVGYYVENGRAHWVQMFAD